MFILVWLYLIVRETCSRENRDLLASGNAVHAINGRDASLDHLFWVNAALRVNGLTCHMTNKICHLTGIKWKLHSKT